MPHPRVRLAPTDADIPGEVLQALRGPVRRGARRARPVARLPGRRPRRGRAGRRRRRRTCPSATRRPCRSSPSTRPARWTSTRRCTSSATATGTASATPSPTCPAFVAARRRARPGHPRARADRLLPGRAGAAAPRGAVARRPRACCRMPCAPPSSGTCASTPRGADVGARCTERWCAASSGSTTRTVQAAVDARHRRRALPAAAARSVSGASRRSAPAVARACRCPSSR